MSSTSSTTRWLERSGARLPWELHLPTVPSRGSVLVTHGYGEHRGYYEHAVAQWVQAGLNVATYDFRGQGQAEGRAHGAIDTFQDYVDDLVGLLQELDQTERWRDVGPPILFCHSTGCLIGVYAALDGRVPMRGLAFTSPYFALAMKVPWPKLLLGRAIGHLMPQCPLPAGLRPDASTKDAEFMERLRTDPLRTRFVTPNWFAEIERVQSELPHRLAKLQLPQLWAVAGSDRIASATKSRELFSLVGATDKQLSVFEHADHHLLLTPERQRYMDLMEQQMLGWCEQ